MDQSSMKKGPWTEEEDCQLSLYVNLFGDRRWDFIAKLSGLKVAGDQTIEVCVFRAWTKLHRVPYNLNCAQLFFVVVGLKRTGKSCRLRWVNYLNPELKRGKMNPQEERMVIQMQAKWGNRWSRIAQKLPGRTDNEIKNYWRTHMRKMAQEKKKTKSRSSSSSASDSSIQSIPNSPNVEFTPVTETKERSFYDTGGLDLLHVPGEKKTGVEIGENNKAYCIDDVWRDFDLYGDNCNLTDLTVNSPTPDYCQIEPLWPMDEDEGNMVMQTMGDQFYDFPFSNNRTG